MPDALLIFDGDDTLWFVEALYDTARAAAASIVAAEGFDPVVWTSLQKAVDLQNVARLGVSTERFPLSCVEAYERIAAGTGPRESIIEAIRFAAESVFSTAAPLAPDAAGVLDELHGQYQLALLTKGERHVQQKRVMESGLAHYFDLIEIVASKTSASFESMLSSLGWTADRAWSIGNSLPSDINPALRIGMSAIWIEAEVWEHERREVEPAPGRMFVADRLVEVPVIVRTVS